MAAEVHQFTVTIPAGTTKAAPYVKTTSLPGYVLESIDLEVPPGAGGLMGFYLAVSGQQWIPWETGEWLVWDDRFDSWYLHDQPTPDSWEVVGYNSDVYAHSVVVRFHVNPSTSSPSSPVPSITFVSTAPAASPVVL